MSIPKDVNSHRRYLLVLKISDCVLSSAYDIEKYRLWWLAHATPRGLRAINSFHNSFMLSTVFIIAVQNISFNDSPLHLESSSFPRSLTKFWCWSFVCKSENIIILHRSWMLPSTNKQYFDCCLCILSKHVPVGVAPTMFVSKTCVICSNSRSCDFGYFKTCRQLFLNETGETRLQITNSNFLMVLSQLYYICNWLIKQAHDAFP